MLLHGQRPKVARVIRSNTFIRQVVSVEEEAAPPRLGTYCDKTKKGQNGQASQVGHVRRQNAEETPKVEPLQADAAFLAMFRQQARTDEEPADPEKEVHAQSP